MTDAEALGLFRGPNTCDDPGCKCREAIAHAVRAIEDRAALVERVDTVRLPDGLCIFIDGIKRHMKGQE